MAQIRNRFDIQNSMKEEEVSVVEKKLPNFFDKTDEINPWSNLTLTAILHVLFAALIVLFAMLQSLIFPFLPKPELPAENIEFRLVQNESKPPINKNTAIRSDKDSQAGGIHDPKKIISEPSPEPAPAVKKAENPKPQLKPQKPQPKVEPKVEPKPQPKTAVKPPVKPVVAQTAPQKPQAPKAVSPVKPSVKPTVKPPGVTAPSAPKIATAPKSPFTMTAPASKAPVGSTYKPAGSPGSSSGGTRGSGTAAPAPKFSSSSSGSGSGSSSGGSSSGARYASRGSSGTGAAGNPSPGNPHGTPGIDAIRQPNWGPYMRDLEQRIKRNWTPPKGDSSKRVVITFTIGRDGRLLSHSVTKSSGIPLADKAAMSAIELTAPFRPLPPEFKGQSVPIEFTFDYNVINSSVLK